MKRVCIFCGSRPGGREVYRETARELGVELARRGMGVVYGGGRVGLMGEVADAALGAGAEVIGVIPRLLLEREVGHAGLTTLHVVETMHQRKAMMASLSEAFVALPGGLGTLEELFEVWTWRQLGLHAKPIGLLDVGGFFGPLVQFLDGLVDDGFVTASNRAELVVDETIEGLLSRLLPERLGGAAEVSPSLPTCPQGVATSPRLHPSTRLTGGLRWGELRDLVAQTVRDAQEVASADRGSVEAAETSRPLPGGGDDEPI